MGSRNLFWATRPDTPSGARASLGQAPPGALSCGECVFDREGAGAALVDEGRRPCGGASREGADCPRHLAELLLRQPAEGLVAKDVGERELEALVEPDP